MKGAYILGTGNISPQPTWNVPQLDELVSYEGSRLHCLEPDYASWIDVKQLRRMSRIMKMGATAAMLALKNAGISKPDAILTGTGFGCLEDTGIFLNRLINQQEQAVNPTPFIQSTHNTIGSHLALMLQCHGYNQTYSQGPFSFENALQDAVLQLAESPDRTVLVGAADEVTDASHQVLRRMGTLKKENRDSLEIFRSPTRGTINGEGSAWFVLAGNSEDKIHIENVRTVYKPRDGATHLIEKFLYDSNTSRDKIDLVLSGKSGDAASDAAIAQQLSNFDSSATGVFKHLCGEYPVASSFALWMAYSILKTRNIPASVIENGHHRNIKSVLIYNRYFRDHHSLILISRDE